jgi:hypothetical protein
MNEYDLAVKICNDKDLSRKILNLLIPTIDVELVNKKKKAGYSKEYYMKNKYEIQKRNRSYKKKYYLENKEKLNKQQRNYYLNNSEKLKEYQRNYSLKKRIEKSNGI